MPFANDTVPSAAKLPYSTWINPILPRVQKRVNPFATHITYSCVLSVVKMEVTFSRCIKDLGSLSPEELSSLFSKYERSEIDKRAFLQILKELNSMPLVDGGYEKSQNRKKMQELQKEISVAK